MGSTSGTTTGSRSKGVSSRSYTGPPPQGLGSHNNKHAYCSNSPHIIWAGRILFLSCLGTSAVLLGYFAHDIISSGEHELAKQQYDAIADRALDAAQAFTLRKTRGAKSMASILSHRFPDSAAWPFVHLEGYEEIATHIIEASDGRALGFCPLVQPGDELERFEQFAYDYFDTAFGAGHNIGVASFGTGIHGQINMTSQFPDRDGRYYDQALGTYTNASKYVYLAPMFQHNSGNSSVLMRNIRNDRDRGPTLDRMMDCFYRQEQPNPAKDCGVISSFKMSADDEPQAFIYQPIRPANSSNLTGFIVSSILWRETLDNIFTDQVSGIQLIISSGNQSYAYSVDEGVISLMGEDTQGIRGCKWKRYQRNISLTEPAFDDSGGFTYTLTLYPTDAMFDTYSTQNPSVAAFGVGCIIIITSFMFVVYDCLVSKNIREKGTLLDAKREFMRYVSHEVRTPLNTVCMGLKILQEDLERMFEGGTDTSTTNNVNQEKEARPSGVVNEEDTVSSSYSTATTTIESPQQSAQASILFLSEEILTSAHSAVGVLNDFLNYDKIETRSLKLDLSVLNVWQELEETLAGFRVPADGKKVNLQLEFDDSLLLSSSEEEKVDEEHGGRPVCNSAKDLPLEILEKRVIGDTARIAQVLRNLISNSLKFTPTGGKVTVEAAWIPPASTTAAEQKKEDRVTITLSNETGVEACPTGFLQVSVRDTGAGMTKEQLDRVFAAGVQFNVNMLQAGQGSGLGMYIAKEIVAQHGGLLTAESEGLGKGATFIMSLPLYDISDDSLPENLQRLRVRHSPGTAMTADAEIPSTDNHQTSKVFEPLHILVVDDAGSNRKLLRRMLERLGHICDEANDGSEAVKKVLGDGQPESAKPPYYDTILLDYEMPVLDGPETIKVLRKEGCDSFVVGITGNILPEDISHFKHCGANEVLHKPVNLQALGALWMEYGITGGHSSNISKASS